MHVCVGGGGGGHSTHDASLCFFLPQGPVIEVTEKMVESVTILVWSAEANSIKKAMQPSAVHDAVCKVPTVGGMFCCPTSPTDLG